MVLEPRTDCVQAHRLRRERPSSRRSMIVLCKAVSREENGETRWYRAYYAALDEKSSGAFFLSGTLPVLKNETGISVKGRQQEG